MKHKHLVFKVIVFLFCSGSLFFSLINWIKDHNQKQFQEKLPINWNKNLITSIQIIKNDEDCLDQYQPVKFAQLFDQMSSDNYKQKHQKDPIQLFIDEVAKIQQDIVNKELSSFAFNKKSQNEQQFWKICTKSMTDISFSSKKNQLLELCETNEKICPVENNKIICISNQFSCPADSSNFCSFDQKQCTVNSKIQCVDKDVSCPKEDKNKQCLSSQKLCIVQDRVLCQDANESCPIVDILILEKTSQTPENYQEEVINFDSDYKLLVKRNDPSKFPIAEIAIFREDKQCLTESDQIQNLFSIQNDSFQLNNCIDGTDKRYQEIFQASLSTKQLFLSNKFIKENEEVNLEFNQSFKIYQRQYNFFDTTCAYSNDFQTFNTINRGIIGTIDLILKSLIVVFLLINLILNQIVKKEIEIHLKKQTQFLIDSSYLMSIIVSITNTLLLYFFDFKQIKLLDDFTSMLIEDQCVDQYLKENIHNKYEQLNILKTFWNNLFIISIIVIIILIVNLIFEIQLSQKNREENYMEKLSFISFFFLISCFFCEGFLLIFNSCCFCIQKNNFINNQVGYRNTRCSCSNCSGRIEDCMESWCNNCKCQSCCSDCQDCSKFGCEQCLKKMKDCPQDCTDCIKDCCGECKDCFKDCFSSCLTDCSKNYGCQSCYSCNIFQGFGECFKQICIFVFQNVILLICSFCKS